MSRHMSKMETPTEKRMMNTNDLKLSRSVVHRIIVISREVIIVADVLLGPSDRVSSKSVNVPASVLIAMRRL